MLHIQISKEDLDRLYPSMKAPSDEQLEDLVQDTVDPVPQHGMKIAEQIRIDMCRSGRTRHAPSSHAASVQFIGHGTNSDGISATTMDYGTVAGPTGTAAMQQLENEERQQQQQRDSSNNRVGLLEAYDAKI